MSDEKTTWENGLLKALRQEARGGYVRSPEECADITKQIIPLCGPASQNRKAAQRIGRWLLRGNKEIIAPVCPDYSHENGIYNFRSLNGGVPLLGELHIKFLQSVVPLIPDARVTLLVADHEADDELLCQTVGKTREEFSALVRMSVAELNQRVSANGWRALAMTDMIKDLVQQEVSCANWISNSPNFNDRIWTETMQRGRMYARIRPSMATQEMVRRTINTAAQYVALGRYAEQNGLLVCNHTTTNLSWYLQTEAAFVHNPVSVY